jgi:DNA-binding HxlR family transcriptional regulator
VTARTLGFGSMYELQRPEACSVGRAMDILGERWTFLILREAFYGVRRFSDMQRNLGIARNILSARLQTLVASGILERRRYQEEPERFEYRLTQAGRDLYPAVIAIMRWGDEHLAGDGGPPVVLRHSCGEEADPVLVCSHCHEPLHPHDVTPEPGPGARVPVAG